MRGRAALIVLLAVAPTLLAASGLPEAAGAGARPKPAARSRVAARPKPAARTSARVRSRGPARAKRTQPPAGPVAPATRILELINADRVAAGLAPLVVRPDLAAIAGGWSGRLAQEGGLRHNSDLFVPASLNRLRVTKLGENVGVSASPEGVHRAFMASPHHRANILDPAFADVGISVTSTGPGRLWVVEDFASPPRPGGR